MDKKDSELKSTPGAGKEPEKISEENGSLDEDQKQSLPDDQDKTDTTAENPQEDKEAPKLNPETPESVPAEDTAGEDQPADSEDGSAPDSPPRLEPDQSVIPEQEKTADSDKTDLDKAEKTEKPEAESGADDSGREPPADTPSQPQASFYLVDLYCSQGMFEPALKTLDILQSLNADPERIAEERRKINQELDYPVDEPAAEPEITGPDAVEAEPAEPTVPDEADDYERQRIAALKRRAGQETDAETEPESGTEEETGAGFDDLAEQKRIAALMKRSGATESEIGQELEETVPEITELEADEAELKHIQALEKHAGIAADSREEPEEEAEDPDEAERIARLEEKRESPQTDLDPDKDLSTEESDETGRPKWLYMTGAALVALIAIWLLWPSGDPAKEFMLPEIEPPMAEMADEIIEDTAPSIPVVTDTIEEELETPEPEAEEEEEVVKTETPKAEPPPVKITPVVTTLPARNMQINARARAAFLNGDYWLAARDWGREKKRVSSNYTIILLFACQDKTIKNAYRQLDEPADFFILPRYIDGEECFTVCWGDFEKRSDALAWYKEIPVWFRDNGAQPLVRSFAQIKINIEPPVKIEQSPVFVPIEKPDPVPEPEPEPEKIEVSEMSPAERPVTVPAEEVMVEELVDTAVVAPETDPAAASPITTVEEAFIDAMIAIPLQETAAVPAKLEPEPEAETPENDLMDSVIVLMADDRPDDWIEMDESTQALEPEAEISGEQYVDIADLETEQPLIPEPEPDYSATDLLRLGRFMEAAGIWEIQKNSKPQNYTVKLLVACQTGSVNDAYRALDQASDFFILPKSIDGNECYAICWGDFTSKREARQRLKEVPEWFSRNKANPIATTIAKIYK